MYFGKYYLLIITLIMGILGNAHASVPVPYSGKVSVDGVNFDGQLKFMFAIYTTSNDMVWDSGSSAIEVPVYNGRYLVLLGGQGMRPLPASLFHENDELYVGVYADLPNDNVGQVKLGELQRITAQPYALVAEMAKMADVANSAETAKVADSAKAVEAGAITKSMLGQDVLSDLNRTVHHSDLSPQIKADISATIGMNRLSAEVILKLDQNVTGGAGVVAGSIISVPYGQPAPAGYSLYQEGTPKWNWEEMAPLSTASSAFDGVEVLGGKIYFVGGLDGSAYRNAARYDHVTNSWEILPSMTEGGVAVASSVLNGKIYAIGGLSVEVFDPSENTWNTGVKLPSDSLLGAAITVDEKIYYIGGFVMSNVQTLNQVLCFDISTNQWSAKANMPTARYGHKLVWFENRIWAIGGYNDAGSLSKVESYDLSSNSWKDEASLTSARFGSTAWIANNRIYVAGGTGSKSLNIIESYNPTTKLWSNIGSLPEAKSFADAVVLNDQVYVIGGQDASGNSSNKVYAADLNSVEGVYDLYRKTITKEILAPDILSDLNATIGLDRLSGEAIAELNSSGLVDNSVTMAKLDPQLRSDLNKTTSRPFGATLANPYGILGTPIYNAGTNYTVPSDKVLLITSSGDTLRIVENGVVSNNIFSTYKCSPVIPPGTTFVAMQTPPSDASGWTGLLFDQIAGVTPILNNGTYYTVPNERTLVITSKGSTVRIVQGNKAVDLSLSKSTPVIPSGYTIAVTSYWDLDSELSNLTGWCGYLLDTSVF
jgi:N-acetylneuraminic acid mutarotase